MECPKRNDCNLKDICTHWKYAEFCGNLSDDEKKNAKKAMIEVKPREKHKKAK